ncbi:MAG: hypothetical protein SH847_18095 [Roseiflexaceae bacterium]|nr:hypothetical protein [Roseiflexaceae bacterium]
MTSQSAKPAILAYTLCYLIWIALCCLFGIAVFQLNGLMLDISLALRLNQWGGRALRQLSFPVLGVVWLIAIFWLEHYLRTAVQLRRLWQRTIRVGAMTIGLFAIIYLIHLLI